MKIDNRPQPQHPGSWFEFYHAWRYLFWLMGFVVLTLLFYAEEDWRGQRAWRQYKQTMIARGENFEPAAFIPPPVPDAENFAMTPALSPLFGFLPGTQRWSNTNAPRLFQDLSAKYIAAANLVKSKSAVPLNSWVRPRTDLALWAAAFAAGTNRTEPAQLIAANYSNKEAATSVVEALEDYRPVLEELRVASQRPHSRFNIRYEEDNPAGILLPHLAKIKQFCQVLQLRASGELALGRTQEALSDVELIFSLANSSRDEPIVISQLVRVEELRLALQPLAEGMGQWSIPQLRELQQQVQRFDFCLDMARALRAERTLFGLGVIEWVRRSPNKARLLDSFEGTPSGPELWPVGMLMAAAPDGWLDFEERNQTRTFDEYILPLIDVQKREISPETVRSAESAIAHLTEGSPLRRFFHHQFFAGLLLPSISRVAQKAAFAQTSVDTATIACAVEEYRLVHGQLPESLDKLRPDVISNLPHDIINGQPLNYRRTTEGHYEVYSVGWNEQDDGGVVQATKHGEIEPREGDWVWTDNF